jgi:hypothetical protein
LEQTGQQSGEFSDTGPMRTGINNCVFSETNNGNKTTGNGARQIIRNTIIGLIGYFNPRKAPVYKRLRKYVSTEVPKYTEIIFTLNSDSQPHNSEAVKGKNIH